MEKLYLVPILYQWPLLRPMAAITTVMTLRQKMKCNLQSRSDYFLEYIACAAAKRATGTL